MDRVPERFHDARDLERDVGGRAPGVDRRHRDELGEAAVHVDAQDAGVLAHVAVAGAARHAVPADDVALARDALAGLDLGDLGATLDHLADELVTERDRGLDPSLRPAVPLEDVEVGAAHAGAQHP